MSRRRLFLAADTYYPSVNGASYFAQRLARHLAVRGHEVYILAPSHDRHPHTTLHEGTTILELPSFSQPIYDGFRWCSSFDIRRAVEQAFTTYQPECVHLQSHFAVGRTTLSVAKKFSVPVLATNHFMPENFMHYFPSLLRAPVRRVMWRDFRRIFSQADRITTPTGTGVKLLQEIGFQKPVDIVSCGIDRTRFHPGIPSTALRTRLRLPNVPVVLSVGRLDKEKQNAFVLMTLARLKERIPFHYVLAGKGAEEQHLRHLVRTLGLEDHVTFAGFVPDEELPELYALANVFCIAGVAELQSIVTLEALATGLPAIGVHAMALPELIHEGKNGYLFQQNDSAALERALLRLLESAPERERMGKESLRIIEHHDIDRTITTFESFYEELLASSAQ